jgi:hypothetical protein
MQGPGRAIEHAVDELAHHRSDDDLLRADGRVDLRLFARLALQVALRLEDVHHRLHGGVGDGAAGAQFVVDLATVAWPRGQITFMISSSWPVSVPDLGRILII